MEHVDEAADCAVLLPVKSPTAGKTRLAGLGGAGRARLAAAFAHDAAAAVLAAPGVARLLVVSDDAAFAATLAALAPGRVSVVDDPGQGLNAALRAGAIGARTVAPAALPVALCADLPALRAEELGEALARARAQRGAVFVSDADGTGTVLYAAPHEIFDPRFGPGSASAHRAGGATPLDGAWPSLRRDVDERGSLADAIALGVGEATCGVLADLAAT